MPISVSMLRCFVTVAQTGTLADAGNRLGRTQSAISMTLKQLEENLGANLFETERKNRLTPLGQQVFELAQQQLDQFDDAITAIETLAQAPGGLLRIASVPSVAHRGLPFALDVMARRHPSLQLDIRDTDTDIILAALLNGQVDIGIVSGQPTLNGVRQEPLFKDDFGLVCAVDHPLIHRSAPPGPDDLNVPNLVRNALCALVKSPEIEDRLNAAQVTARNTLSLISMVRTGKWITILPRSVVGILPGYLAFRHIEGLTDQRTVSLLIRARCLFPDLAQELGQVLRAYDWSAEDTAALP
ncbi:MAG: LysR family transcriptional regulator [Pseudomonadota bacterium]